MESEINKEYGCRIYSVFFQPDDVSEKAKNTLNKIAEYGGTKKYLNSTSLDSLNEVFNTISDTIEKTFILKYK